MRKGKPKPEKVIARHTKNRKSLARKKPEKNKKISGANTGGLTRKYERRELDKLRAQLFATTEATLDFVGFADAKSKQILYINKAGRKMVGIGERDDVTRLKISNVHPDWTNKIFSAKILPSAIRKGVWHGECAFLHSDGHEIPVFMMLMAHKNSKGKAETFSTISRDISERIRMEEELRSFTKTLEKRVRERTSALEKANKELEAENRLRKKTEKALKESEHLYRTLIEKAPDAIFLVGNDQKVIACNKQVALMHGFDSADELIGKTILDFIGEDEYQHAQESWREIMETGSLRNAEFMGKMKDGTRFPTEINVNLMHDSDGNPMSQIAVVRDISERKKMEDKLRESEQQYRSIIETSRDLIWSHCCPDV